MIRFIIIGFLGLFMIMRPDICWKIECFFKIKSGQPSIWYAKILRAGGMVFLIIAILMLAYQLFFT